MYELYTGVTYRFTEIDEGDDYIDHGYVWESNFPFESDYPHDMGNAYVIWHKVH